VESEERKEEKVKEETRGKGEVEWREERGSNLIFVCGYLREIKYR